MLKPWLSTLYRIKTRCNNPKAENFHRYGGRGIKCLITGEELKKLWFRDKAYKLNRPSIDRIDNDGNYEYKNCRYISVSDNVSRMVRPKFCPSGHPYTGKNLFFKYCVDYGRVYKSRSCRKCTTISQTRYMKRRRARRQT